MSDDTYLAVEDAQPRVVYVTRAQQLAAQLIIDRRRRPVTEAIRKIAAAR